MWSFCKLILLFLLATVCHWSLATLFSFCGLSVNMMLVFAIVFCAVLKPIFGYSIAFVCGLFLDFFGTKLFGNNAFSFTVAACTVYALAQRFDFEAFFPQMFSVFGLTIGVAILNSFLLYWFTSSAMWPGFWSLLGGAVVVSLVSPGIFWLVRRVLGQGFVCR